MHTENDITDTAPGGTPGASRSTEATGAPLAAEQAPGRTGVPTAPQTAPQGLPVPLNGVTEAHATPAPRPWTPETSSTIVMKRACNGCGTRLGDVTDQEMACGINGLPLPDVRRECPTCGPTAPEPACRPLQIVAGDPLCLEVECDHDLEDDAEYCAEVVEETVCGTHSELSNLGEVLQAQPWPCKHTKTVTA